MNLHFYSNSIYSFSFWATEHTNLSQMKKENSWTWETREETHQLSLFLLEDVRNKWNTVPSMVVISDFYFCSCHFSTEDSHGISKVASLAFWVSNMFHNHTVYLKGCISCPFKVKLLFWIKLNDDHKHCNQTCSRRICVVPHGMALAKKTGSAYQHTESVKLIIIYPPQFPTSNSQESSSLFAYFPTIVLVIHSCFHSLDLHLCSSKTTLLHSQSHIFCPKNTTSLILASTFLDRSEGDSLTTTAITLDTPCSTSVKYPLSS